MIAPSKEYHNDQPEPLADLRVLVSLHPEALYLEACGLARLLCCSEAEAEEARRWMLSDGLEVRV